MQHHRWEQLQPTLASVAAAPSCPPPAAAVVHTRRRDGPVVSNSPVATMDDDDDEEEYETYSVPGTLPDTQTFVRQLIEIEKGTDRAWDKSKLDDNNPGHKDG